jgi:hypothetical protein
MRRILAALMIAAVSMLVAGFVVVTSRDASASDPVAEADFVGKINGYRASQGVGPVQAHPVLTAKAQAWAAHMAATGCLCHSNLSDGVSVSWRKLGENVGRGPNVAALHDAFIASPAHRDNMVDGRFQWVGVGVAYGAGQMWVAEVFMDGAGPPAPSGTPFGNFEMATRVPGQIAVQGWAIDPDTANPIDVHVYVDGRWAGQASANQGRGDVGHAFPRYGANHGYAKFVGVGNGPHSVCVYAINAGNGAGNPRLGCTVVQNTPFGNLEQATPTPLGTVVSGWAVGRDTTAPIDVHLYFNGGWLKALNAGAHRGDVGAAFPGYQSGHGFTVAVPNQTGILCAYGIARNGGQNSSLGCRLVNTNPIGNFESANRNGGAVRLQGWALDRDTNGPVDVHVYVDGRGVASFPANVPRGDVSAAFRTGGGHAFDATVGVPGGYHYVCAYAINRASGTTNPLLGCRLVT